jgi:succinyl-diaminopimelate desuccinylase
LTAARPSATGGAIDVDAHGVVEFTQQLVRLRSVYDPASGDDESVVAELVANKMREFGWDVQLSEVAPGRPNVLGTVAGTAPGPTLAFEGHLDVVTEGDPDRWTVDPFGAEIRDGRLYGRGSADMKSGVAAMLYGVRALQQAGPFPGTIKVCVLVDEEGMMLGAKQAAASGALADVAAVIVCEPEGGEVCPAAKGAIRLRLDFTGKMAHGAMPEQGRNPLPALAAAVSRLGDLQTQLQREHGSHPHLGTIWITPTVVVAGDARQMNVIPATASLYVDVRTVPGVDHARLVDEARRRAAAAANGSGVRVEVSVVDDRPCVDTPADHPIVAAVRDAHELVTGTRPPLGGVPGTTDGTILARDAGLPSVVYGPGGKWIAHQADEFVEVEEIARYARVYAEAARQFLSSN